MFLTGHTGFKGGWLSIWLHSLGAKVRGFSLAAPTNPSLFSTAKVWDCVDSVYGDIRDLASLRLALIDFEPEVVIHMAAQPLVRRSYADPLETFSSNVMGTVNVLEAVRGSNSVRSVVVVTSDKCYENREWLWGYRENEAMGGHDPYSGSKGCAELVTAAYRRSYFEKSGVAVATARAGNVIGGGDWADDRLVPDVLRAFQQNQKIVLRNPESVRPWQHVLEPLSGYLTLAERLHDVGVEFADGWNFGPGQIDVKTVEWIVNYISGLLGSDALWEIDSNSHFHEANCLTLDSSKARRLLNWRPRWGLESALRQTVAWHQCWLEGGDVRGQCINDIYQFMCADSIS